MPQVLKILMAEDNPNDAELVLRELRRAGFEPIWYRVDTEAEYVQRLDENLDVILSDYEMPQFSGLRALELLKTSGLDIPFIIISGTIGEDTAVSAMKQGATDYLLKDRLARLAPAVTNALDQKRLRLERLQSLRTLHESEEYFRRLIENSTDVIIVIDDMGGIEFMSPSVQRALGYRPDVMLGRSILDFIHSEDRVKVGGDIQRALASPESTRPVDYRIRHDDGTWRTFQSVGKRVTETTGRVKIVVNSRDVTESRLLEEKLLRAQRMEAVGTLASGVAHDLNNILTPMLMVAGLLKETLLEQRDRDLLLMVEQSAQRGAGIINQLLTFSRGIEGARVIVQPRYLLREIATLMQETFPRNIVLGQEVADDLLSVLVDTTQFHQVLLNLCVNARDAMPNGGRLTLTARNVRLSEAEVRGNVDVTPGNYVLLSVSDTGDGIPVAIIERIFDPFFTTKQIGKGTGLGLSTVLGIVKSHKGFVNVYSEVSRGTIFRVYLPAVETAAGPQLPVAALPPAGGHEELILLVDDETPILTALRDLLEKQNYRVLVAGNGEEAIRLFLQQSHAIQLVVTDVMMPVMDGLALINTLRKLKPAIKVIATTGLEAEEKFGELAALGVIATLAKPFSPPAMLKAIQQALRA